MATIWVLTCHRTNILSISVLSRGDGCLLMIVLNYVWNIDWNLINTFLSLNCIVTLCLTWMRVSSVRRYCRQLLFLMQVRLLNSNLVRFEATTDKLAVTSSSQNCLLKINLSLKHQGLLTMSLILEIIEIWLLLIMHIVLKIKSIKMLLLW